MAHILTSQILLVVWLVAIALQMFWLHRQGTSKHYDQTVDQMKEHILWKMFYINPDDPRAWVRKTWGPGYTVNFRSRGQAFLFAFLIFGTFATALGLTAAAFSAMT